MGRSDKRATVVSLLATSLVGAFLTVGPIDQAAAGFLFNDDNKQQLLTGAPTQSHSEEGGSSSTSITSRSLDATPVGVVPEPSTIVLLGSGLLGLGLWKLKKRS